MLTGFRIPNSLVIALAISALIFVDASTRGLMTTSRLLMYVVGAGLSVVLYECLPRRRKARRLAKRRRMGLCLQCGYNILGADHERCPECGHGLPEVQ
ncbi:MAG: hypothetical protein O7G85_15780 [Planctomycetota bacterium]|nr:hypothetical protein [Planctomycetota bacterium]